MLHYVIINLQLQTNQGQFLNIHISKVYNTKVESKMFKLKKKREKEKLFSLLLRKTWLFFKEKISPSIYLNLKERLTPDKLTPFSTKSILQQNLEGLGQN